MLHERQNLETRPLTDLDRWVDRSLSSGSDEVAHDASFEAAAGSAPPNQELGESEHARPESRAAAFAASRPPTPNDWIGWPGSGCGGGGGMGGGEAKKRGGGEREVRGRGWGVGGVFAGGWGLGR